MDHDPDRDPNDSPTSGPLLFRLHGDVIHLIFSRCSARSIAQLSQTCRYLRDSIAEWQGYNSVAVVTLDNKEGGEEDSYSLIQAKDHAHIKGTTGTFPPHYRATESIQIGSKLYLPVLSESPSCYVLDVEVLNWSKSAHLFPVHMHDLSQPVTHFLDAPDYMRIHLVPDIHFI